MSLASPTMAAKVETGDMAVFLGNETAKQEAFAPSYGAVENELEYYEVNGAKYIDVAGVTYEYLTGEDFKPVEDLQIIQMLEMNATNSDSTVVSYASSALPVPPTYSYDLANGSYSGSVDLSNGNQWSPIFKRAVPKRYTNFSVDTILTKTVSIGYFYYNAYEEKWYGDYKNDMTFNILVDVYQLQFGTMGDAAQGLRILFFDYDNSTQSFDYTITDTNVLL